MDEVRKEGSKAGSKKDCRAAFDAATFVAFAGLRDPLSIAESNAVVGFTLFPLPACFALAGPAHSVHSNRDHINEIEALGVLGKHRREHA